MSSIVCAAQFPIATGDTDIELIIDVFLSRSTALVFFSIVLGCGRSSWFFQKIKTERVHSYCENDGKTLLPSYICACIKSVCNMSCTQIVVSTCNIYLYKYIFRVLPN